MSDQKQPKVKFGFYATIPRIVRIKYKDLSHAEKWLYVCLKDLCGDKGTCFRTLRSLSGETDISIASLSKMIPHLHSEGLIHAEKKRRSESGKEVWHISIVDIWQENVKACSKNEQSQEVVQNTNKDVQNLNETLGDCSKNERDCSNFSDRRMNSESRTDIEEITLEERMNGASPTNSTPETSIHSSSSPLVEFTEEEERVYEHAKKLKLSYLKKNEKNKAHCAKLLSEEVTTLEQMESLIQFCRQRPYLVGKDLNLGNLASELDGWLQVQQSQVSGRVLSSYDDPDYVDDTFYVTRVTDEELAEDVRDKVHAFREDDRFDIYLQEIKQIKVQFSLTNFDLCNLMANTCRKVTPGNSTMDDFIHEMQELMY
jgi:hypothetical protein